VGPNWPLLVALLADLCIFIPMVAKGNASRSTIHEFSDLLIEKGATQADIAKKLKISQGYLSKLLRNRLKPGRLLEGRCRRLLDAQESGKAELRGWLDMVEEAARRSDDFRDLVSAAIKIIH
jgi:transcriptional regulator with XRE-family HTH domain